MLNDDIEAADFRAVKMEAEREITMLECKINELRSNNMSVSEVEKIVDGALVKLTNIDTIYCKSEHYGKRKLIGSIYPEKFTFEDLKVRTAKTSDIVSFIYLINNKLRGNKKGTNGEFYRLSQEVIPMVLEPEKKLNNKVIAECLDNRFSVVSLVNIFCYGSPLHHMSGIFLFLPEIKVKIEG